RCRAAARSPQACSSVNDAHFRSGLNSRGRFLFSECRPPLNFARLAAVSSVATGRKRKGNSMRRRLLPLVFVFALFTTLAGQQPAQAQQRPFAGFDEPGGYRLTFVVAGRERSINVWVTEGYDPDGEPVPLL